MPGFRLPAVLSALAALALTAGCDSLPGPQPVDPAVPSATARVCYAPALPDCQTAVTWEALPEALREGDSVAVVPVEVEVELSEAAISASYVVAWQFGSEPTLTGAIAEGAGRTVVRDTLRLARGARGAYTVTVTPEGTGRVLGGPAVAQLSFGGEPLGPPALSALEATETLQTPGTLEVSVAVADPDGAVNISDVEARADGLGLRLPLRDDGQGGDARSGDGRWTVRVSVPDSFAVGDFGFRLTATDRDGLAADPLPFTVTFVE